MAVAEGIQQEAEEVATVGSDRRCEVERKAMTAPRVDLVRVIELLGVGAVLAQAENDGELLAILGNARRQVVELISSRQALAVLADQEEDLWAGECSTQDRSRVAGGSG
jgi:hypothetical protein